MPSSGVGEVRSRSGVDGLPGMARGTLAVTSDSRGMPVPIGKALFVLGAGTSDLRPDRRLRVSKMSGRSPRKVIVVNRERAPFAAH
jgi:hypothetical protein